jgi:hypothetical protein
VSFTDLKSSTHEELRSAYINLKHKQLNDAEEFHLLFNRQNKIAIKKDRKTHNPLDEQELAFL